MKSKRVYRVSKLVEVILELDRYEFVGEYRGKKKVCAYLDWAHAEKCEGRLTVKVNHELKQYNLSCEKHKNFSWVWDDFEGEFKVSKK